MTVLELIGVGICVLFILALFLAPRTVHEPFDADQTLRRWAIRGVVARAQSHPFPRLADPWLGYPPSSHADPGPLFPAPSTNWVPTSWEQQDQDR